MTSIESPSLLSTTQQSIVSELVADLETVDGIEAIALGGSFATGFARTGSDIDLGLLYSENAPFSIDAIRAVAALRNDTSDPVVTDFYQWGPWVNGGAWLTVRRQRVDLIYRCIEHIERVICDAEAGRFEADFEQMPPFGFFGPTYLGELSVAVPLHDPGDRLDALRERVSTYPDALRSALVDSRLWAIEFGLAAFADKFAARDDTWLTTSALSRFGYQLTTVLFALNRVYPVNDKTALAQVGGFAIAPDRFHQRIESTLAHVGRGREELAQSVCEFRKLFDETVALAGDLYRPRTLP